MYQDEVFENALKEAKEREFTALKADIKGIEIAIDKFLTQLLECTSIASERDFYVCGI